MSLDVYLTGETTEMPCACERCGHEHTRKEVQSIYDANITHNLTAMAKEAGIYKHLWRPEEVSITTASQLITPLRDALALMKSDPPRFIQHNPPNGWGSYEGFLPWVERYLAACEHYPTANVSVSR